MAINVTVIITKLANSLTLISGDCTVDLPIECDDNLVLFGIDGRLCCLRVRVHYLKEIISCFRNVIFKS